MAATKGLSEAQLEFKPAPERWSVAEVLKHSALVADGIFDSVTEKVMKEPGGAADRHAAKADALVLAMVPDRSNKRQAPLPFVAKGSWTRAETLEHFEKSRARGIEFLNSTPDLRAQVGHSPLGTLAAYEWLLFMAAHSERHTKQILEVKADPNFPNS